MKKRRSPRVRVSEVDLVNLLATALRAEGYRVRVEVPNMGQSADVVATRSRWVTVIEVKVADWKRALEQCLAHEQVADFVCIALGMKSVPPALLELATERGYGILLCSLNNATCDWAVLPRRNEHTWRPQRSRFSAAMRAINHEH